FSPVFDCFSVVYLHLDQNFTRKSVFFMRFYSFFARFWVNYRIFLGGCLSFLGIIFFINVHI
ncbi:hypothetical protein, partial [Bacteroides thetaiotaomicron]|uniref:hypothetical protein n=1 Tax=Bacteroides thetaiotaomicron TaxID=818 RepID=UPI001F35D0CD